MWSQPRLKRQAGSANASAANEVADLHVQLSVQVRNLSSQIVGTNPETPWNAVSLTILRDGARIAPTSSIAPYFWRFSGNTVDVLCIRLLGCTSSGRNAVAVLIVNEPHAMRCDRAVRLSGDNVRALIDDIAIMLAMLPAAGSAVRSRDESEIGAPVFLPPASSDD